MADRLPAGEEGQVDIKKIEKILQFETYRMYYNACHQWAKFFEFVNMAWVYCPGSGRVSELDKTADFYLPDQGAYFVVNFGRPGRGFVAYKKLSKQSGRSVILGSGDGTFRIFEGGEAFSDIETVLCQCAACGRWYFMNEPGSYTCRVCGEYDGDHHILQWIDGSGNVFEKMPVGCEWLFQRVKG